MQKQCDNVILELTVRNHPGVMTHVCGLFARRAFNVEGILCLPIQGSEHSRIWLLVNDDQRLGQMISQIEKLEDVTKVARNQSDPTMFNKIAVFFEADQPPGFQDAQLAGGLSLLLQGRTAGGLARPLLLKPTGRPHLGAGADGAHYLPRELFLLCGAEKGAGGAAAQGI